MTMLELLLHVHLPDDVADFVHLVVLVVLLYVVAFLWAAYPRR